MKKIQIIFIAAIAIFVIPSIVLASPKDDLKKFRGYFTERFPEIKMQDYSNGVYSVDLVSREQWEAIEEFPPYEIAIEEGEELFNTAFKNGKSYASCFKNSGIGVADQYPYFNTETGQVHTLAFEINLCREKNGETPLKYKKGAIASILAYMAYTTRGKLINTKIPDDERALQAYERGKSFYYARRGQLNMACAHCHVDNAGNRLRAEILSPGIGQVSHFPVYRAKWGAMGTLHRRFAGCNAQVRAKPFPAQSQQYRELEYFLSFMSNGIHWNGPGVRR